MAVMLSSSDDTVMMRGPSLKGFTVSVDRYPINQGTAPFSFEGINLAGDLRSQDTQSLRARVTPSDL